MSTKDTLTSLGLLAVGGVAIAAAAGVGRKGSRATEDDLVTVPWTRRQMFEAGLYLFEAPSGPTAFWTQEDWFKRVSRWTAFAVAKHGSWEQFKRNGNRAVPCDDARFKTREEALAHADALAKSSPGSGFEVISVLVRPSDVKGSRSTSAEALLGVVEEAEGLVERERFGTAIRKLRSAQGGWTGDRQVYDLLARAIRVLDDESYEAVPAGTGKAVLKRIADHVRANP